MYFQTAVWAKEHKLEDGSTVGAPWKVMDEPDAEEVSKLFDPDQFSDEHQGVLSGVIIHEAAMNHMFCRYKDRDGIFLLNDNMVFPTPNSDYAAIRSGDTWFIAPKDLEAGVEGSADVELVDADVLFTDDGKTIDPLSVEFAGRISELIFSDQEEIEKMWKEGEKSTGAAFAAMVKPPDGITYVNAEDVPSMEIGSKCDYCPERDDCPIRPVMEILQ